MTSERPGDQRTPLSHVWVAGLGGFRYLWATLSLPGGKMEADIVLEGIARGEFHRAGALKCSELFTVNTDFFSTLHDELRTLAARNAPSEVQEKDHVTNWTKPIGRAIQFSLLNESGDFSDTSRDHQLTTQGKRFHHAAEYPTIAAFIAMFPHAVNMRLNGMAPGGGLSPHEENVAWQKGIRWYFRARFHLPIVTNPDAFVFLDGDLLHLEQGKVYYFNNGCVHSAVNRGETDRFHLVWDMLLTEETIDLMFGDDSHPPLERTPSNSRGVPVVKSEPVGRYETIGRGEELYRYLRLKNFNIEPYQWQNVYNLGRYLSYRVTGKPSAVSVL
jgi:hypothetical protein